MCITNKKNFNLKTNNIYEKTGVRQNQQQQENWDCTRTLSSKKMIIAEKKFYYRIQSFL